jgi:hypothetical protein
MTRVALHSFLAVYHALCIFAYSVVGTCFVACCNQCYPAVFVVGFPLQVLIGCHIIANCVLSLPPPLPTLLSLCSMIARSKTVECTQQSKQNLCTTAWAFMKNGTHIVIFLLLPIPTTTTLERHELHLPKHHPPSGALPQFCAPLLLLPQANDAAVCSN